MAALAVEQHGVVTLAQLCECGLSVRAVHKRVVAGRLHWVHQGVFAVGHAGLTWRGMLLAAVRACGPDAVVSHRSAAELWGIVHRPPAADLGPVEAGTVGSIDVTAPRRRGRSPESVRAHRDGTLRAVDRASVDGIPCTTVARTLLDLVRVTTRRELRAALGEAEVLGVLDLDEMRDLLKSAGGRFGVARLRAAVEGLDARAGLTKSELERRFLALCREARLPDPEVNFRILLPDGPVVGDFVWPRSRLTVEADGRRFHDTGTAFERDRRRDQRLKLAGWEVLRCTWRQVAHDPHDLVRTIRALLSRR